MSILSLASNASAWRGYEYYKDKKVVVWSQINDSEYEAEEYIKEIEEYERQQEEREREEEERWQERYEEVEEYVNSLSEEEVRQALISTMLELEERNWHW